MLGFFSLASGALAGVDQPENLILVRADLVGPSVTASGEVVIAGRGVSGNITAPLPSATGYAQVFPSGIRLVSSQVGVDSDGDLLVSYPAGTQFGDVAVLCIGWESDSSGAFTAATGWTSGQAEYATAQGQIFTRKIADPSEVAEFVSGGSRNGGGYLLHIYRRAEWRVGSDSNGGTDAVSFSTINVLDDGYIALFAVSVGQNNTLQPGDVSAPFTALDTIRGGNGTGEATLWSAYGQITTGDDPAYAPANITPTFTFIADHDWVSFGVALTEVPFTHGGSGASLFPAAQVSGEIQVSRVGIGAAEFPFPFVNGAITVNTSGREVDFADGGGNSVKDFQSNRVLVDVSVNRVAVSSFKTEVT